MSLALFHEYLGSQQGVDQTICGRFVSPDSSDFILLESQKLSLYQEVLQESTGSSLRYVPDVRVSPMHS